MKKMTFRRLALGTEVSNGTLETYYPDHGDPEGYMRDVGIDYAINGQQDAYDAMLADSRNWDTGETREIVLYSVADSKSQTVIESHQTDWYRVNEFGERELTEDY